MTPAVSLPPRGFGVRGDHEVLVERRTGGAWIARVDGRPLGDGFESERAARVRAAAQVLRMNATELALLRRVRRGLSHKQR